LPPSGIGRKTPAFRRRLQFGFLRRDLGTKAHRHKAESKGDTELTLCLCPFVPQAVGFSRQQLIRMRKPSHPPFVREDGKVGRLRKE